MPSHRTDHYVLRAAAIIRQIYATDFPPEKAGYDGGKLRFAALGTHGLHSPGERAVLNGLGMKPNRRVSNQYRPRREYTRGQDDKKATALSHPCIQARMR